jgi:AraC family transcriptional regulator
MSKDTVEEVLAQRFQIRSPPTVLAKTAAKEPVIFTHLRSPEALDGRSMDIRGEDAFAFQVPLQPSFFSNVWHAGKHTRLPVAAPGSVYLFDLSSNPVVELDKPFDTLRLYISQSTLDEMAYARGLPRVGGLRASVMGGPDLILFGMAQTLAASLAQPEQISALFTEYMALAFHEHVIRSYGNAPAQSETIRGGLAPWQLRRAHEFISANLGGDTSIEQLANESGVSASHFARAFKQTMGMAPHQWLTKKRIERAKSLLRRNDLELADIALACGFVDQSHFTRVFSRSEGSSPGKWRRLMAG